MFLRNISELEGYHIANNHYYILPYSFLIGIVLTTIDNGCVLVTLDFLLLIKRSFSWRILSSKTLAGSLLGFCGTSFPCIAHCNMLFFNCLPFIAYNFNVSLKVIGLPLSLNWSSNA